ncbi:RagB/SusD family nutrient uptake outer membrane protein [Cyclobacterium plantarum]|uniref:RagB/SusD family nutrient uptake outer membrane protein n=1 Tax=Cyclobacterium plantarum TaxID=2716263 RepID=A0ABX0HDI8_9BACT|nr:RagB/SusD family nutrient uptake outer membrane protein [Cyclobacterium plantarum]NHE59799.1 RagB/SusD family nutrient uptake outer membrane protein [Cyclobacterium plantarum]
MKFKNIQLQLLMSACLLLFSCDHQLELTPAQGVEPDIALGSSTAITRVLTGAYSGLRNQELLGGRTILYAEMLGANNEIRWEGTFNQPREMYNKSIFTNNSYITNTWLRAYSTINTINNVLEVIDRVNESDRNRVRGEALFLRGAVYFELVKLYGLPYAAGNTETNLAVPIMLNPTLALEEVTFDSRNTVEEVYQQVLEDLETAESLLPESNGFFARNYVASALLSRVYLQMERFEDARDAANRSITVATENGKSLIDDYMSAFNNPADTQEDLFAIQVNAQDPDNAMHLFYSTPDFGGRDGDVTILPTHINQYEEGDERLEQFVERAGEIRTDKWRDQFRNVKVIRLAEMYLTRAEANFREGTSVGATPLEDINRIRARVNLPAKSSLSLEEILMERKLELAHEGHYIHDIKRTRGEIQDNNTDDLQYNYDDPRMVLPIPQREMDANPELVQNPGYGG